ncbi:major facilitator superfamily domain-containing protein [Microdochium trichocladiopsis]|uniref:Major facilitator superfamily domain-containing protein n=1 Tax=Microdochium trichocladiopsis TaxID=1682393 RepID=A0A9P8Y9X4_9PEZI|nr:major facilitator superfamily domain-containing protein [Microdochium trichocladiopsis]KAH7031454.1 major facilitator superfamily domain-containing protein [Microdochium trichocladiopsis]
MSDKSKVHDLERTPSSQMAAPDDAVELTAAQNRHILLKTDLVIMPLAIVCMTLAFLDKNALGYAALFGLKEDNHLQGQDYSWLGSVFYFGYLGMELPSVWLITKVPIGKFIGVCIVLWGVALCLMAVCHNFAGLATIRFFLGVFEAALLPCMLVINAMWYRREEQPLRTAFWYNTFAGVFGGILSYAIGGIKGSLSVWKYIFLIYGAVTVLFGFVLFVALPDSPSQAWFFNEEERKLAIARLASNQTGTDVRKRFNFKQIWEAFRDPKCYCVWACVFGYAIANAGITNFNPLIISGYGFTPTKTTLMATPQAAVAMVSGAVLTGISYFVPNLRCIFWAASAVVGLAGAVMVHSLDPVASRNASLAGVYIMGFYNVPWVFMLSLQSSNTAGATKKSFMGVSVAIVYAVGNIVGPQLFLSTQAPRYQLGIGAMIFAFALMAVAGILYYLLCVAENRRRDSSAQETATTESGAGHSDADAEDLTDIQNRKFRYTY